MRMVESNKKIGRKEKEKKSCSSLIIEARWGGRKLLKRMISIREANVNKKMKQKRSSSASTAARWGGVTREIVQKHKI